MRQMRVTIIAFLMLLSNLSIAHSSVSKNKLTHKMEIEGYKVEEIYERMD